MLRAEELSGDWPRPQEPYLLRGEEQSPALLQTLGLLRGLLAPHHSLHKRGPWVVSKKLLIESYTVDSDQALFGAWFGWSL